MVTIVLVRPQMGENIGAAARVMSNFGLTDLRIVAPRDGWPNDKATSMAAHGDYIIENARVYETVTEALNGCTQVFATTATRRDMVKPVTTPREAAANFTDKTAVLFGPERAGLENEDMVLADAIIEIPTDEKNSSLNLAQAVCVVAYEWFTNPAGRNAAAQDLVKQGKDPVQAQSASQDVCTREDLQGFFDQLETTLDESGYFRIDHKKPLMWQHLRNIFVKAKLSEQEVRTLRGMFKALSLRA